MAGRGRDVRQRLHGHEPVSERGARAASFMSVVFDSGVIVALYDRRDAEHERCRRLLRELTEPRFIPSPTLPEIDYWLSTRIGPEAFVQVLRDIRAGAYRVQDLDGEDYERVLEIISVYADSDVGFVDAAVLAVAERLRTHRVATLDHRHFRMMRPRHVESLTLLPE